MIGRIGCASTARRSRKRKSVRAAWESEVKEAVKDKGWRHRMEPDGAREPDAPHKRRIYSTDPTMRQPAI